MVDVDTAKRKLVEALGGCAEKYWSNMKLWYKQKISKDDFDTQAFEFLGPGRINYHNEFIISILAKCEMIAYSTPQNNNILEKQVKGTMKSSQLCKPHVRRSNISPIPQVIKPFVYDDGMDSIPIIIPKTLLRNVLSACIARRKQSEIRQGSHFPYRFGHAELKSDILNERLISNRYELNGQQYRTYDQAESLAHAKLACGRWKPAVQSPISLFTLRDALLESPQVIPSISLRTTTLERVSNYLWHPSKEELHQNKMYILDTKKVHQKIKQQRALRTEFLKV